MREGRSCPFGHTCDECHLQVEVTKMHTVTGDVDKYTTCALTEAVALQHAAYQQANGFGQVLESTRNALLERDEPPPERLVHEPS
mgnify:FL=1